MKDKKIIDAWEKITPSQEADERMQKAILRHNYSRKPKKHFILPVVISMALVLMIAIPLLSQDDSTQTQTTEIKEETDSNEEVLVVVNNEEDVSKEKRNIIWTGGNETEFIYKDDPGILKNLYEEGDVIVKVLVTKPETESDAMFFPGQVALGSHMPITPVGIEITEVIYGEMDENIQTVYIDGGTLPIQELFLNLPQGTVEKMNLPALSEEERKNSYATYHSDADISFVKENEYILVLAQSPASFYRIAGNGYGTYIQDNQGSDSFQNAVSKRDFTTDFEALKESLNR